MERFNYLRGSDDSGSRALFCHFCTYIAYLKSGRFFVFPFSFFFSLRKKRGYSFQMSICDRQLRRQCSWFASPKHCLETRSCCACPSIPKRVKLKSRVRFLAECTKLEFVYPLTELCWTKSCRKGQCFGYRTKMGCFGYRETFEISSFPQVGVPSKDVKREKS